MAKTNERGPRRPLAVLRAALWAMVVVVAAILLYLWTFGFQSVERSMTAATEPYGTPFTLIDQNGEPITEAALRGRPSAVFFGFTHCPDICPTTLYELAGHKQALEQEGQDLNVVFVTVDPERDTPEILGQYVGSMGTPITAITGEPAEVDAMLEGWGIQHEKVGEGDNYTMDHTASVILLGSAGQFVGTIPYGENPETAREALRRLATL
ncbi:SCO family protein [Aureimonas mangrovi]|uniref:SCO family protein n=1 Tax=Aureimonas mangrovi TaxID=2758041 RepID=UPI00163D5380|nr:SCO family protein [Aureimonas mangrovi]